MRLSPRILSLAVVLSGLMMWGQFQHTSAQTTPQPLLIDCTSSDCTLSVDNAQFQPQLFMDINVTGLSSVTPVHQTSSDWSFKKFQANSIDHVLFSQGVGGPPEIFTFARPSGPSLELEIFFISAQNRSIATPFKQTLLLGGTVVPGSSTPGGGQNLQSSAPVCGNGIAEGREECDGNDFGVNTCGPGGGTLKCTANCLIDGSSCSGSRRGGGGGGGGGGFFIGFPGDVPVTARSSGEKCFPDISDDMIDYVCFLEDEGIIEGYPDGTFKPFRTLNRAEYVKIMMLAILSEEAISEAYQRAYPRARQAAGDGPETNFPDVRQKEWFARYVNAANKRRAVEGYPDGEFKPGNSINQAEAMKVALESMRSKIDSLERFLSGFGESDPWFFKYLSYGAQAFEDLDILEGKAERRINRAEFAQLITELLRKSQE